MIDLHGRIAEAAGATIGCPFRLYGRDPAIGLDCVGLVLFGLRAIGLNIHDPQPYALRNKDISLQLTVASKMGLAELDSEIGIGSILLLKVGPAQHHLGVISSRIGLLHAHAGLGRVVETPLYSLWPIVRHWRLADN